MIFRECRALSSLVALSIGAAPLSCDSGDSDTRTASSDSGDGSDSSSTDSAEAASDDNQDSFNSAGDASASETNDTDAEVDVEPDTTDDEVQSDGVGESTDVPASDADTEAEPSDAAAPEPELPEAKGPALLGVYGTDINSGDVRTWLVNTDGERTELTPNPSPFPHLFELDGELVLFSQEQAESGAQRMLFHPVEGATVQAPGVREFPQNARRSADTAYAYEVNVLESEQREFESGIVNWVQTAELGLLDGLNPEPIPVTDNLPPFSTIPFSLPTWSPTTSELYYAEATNDDVENPTWEILAVEIDGRELGEPQPVIDNAVWLLWSDDGRWFVPTIIEDPWAISVFATPRHKWLVEQGTWQRYDLGAEAPNEETTWRFSPDSRWLFGERRNPDGISEVVSKRVPDGDVVSIAKPPAGGSLLINSSHPESSRFVVREDDASGAHVRSHYVDLEGDESQIATVEGAHFFGWPGPGDLLVTYVSEPPGTQPGPEMTGTARLYRTLPTPQNLLHELQLTHWLHASANDEHFVYHTDDGWFSIGATPDAEPISIDLGSDIPDMTDARYHPTLPHSYVSVSEEQSHVWLLSWPEGNAQTTLVEFPEIENMYAYWVVPLPWTPPPFP